MGQTVLEVEAKAEQLTVEMTTALEAAKVLTPATPEFDEAYGRYLASKAGIAKIPAEIATAKVAENAGAIAAAEVTVSEAIAKLLEGLKVAELIGEPVIALRYYRIAKADEAGVETVSIGAKFNPVAALKKTGASKAGTGRTTIVSADGSHQSLTKFVLEHATEEEKGTDAYKYPHTQVDSKPKFEAFCTAHNLSGFVYQLPSEA